MTNFPFDAEAFETGQRDGMPGGQLLSPTGSPEFKTMQAKRDAATNAHDFWFASGWMTGRLMDRQQIKAVR